MHACWLAESWGLGKWGRREIEQRGKCGRRGSLGNIWRYGARVQCWGGVWGGVDPGQNGEQAKSGAQTVVDSKDGVALGLGQRREEFSSLGINTPHWVYAPPPFRAENICLVGSFKPGTDLPTFHDHSLKPVCGAAEHTLVHRVFSCCCTKGVERASCSTMVDYLAALYYYLGMAYLICQEILRSGCSVPGPFSIPGSSKRHEL